MMRNMLLTGLAAACVFAAPVGAAQPARPLYPKGHRSVMFDRPIGRVEVDREDVIAITAPSARSLLLTGLHPGSALLSVYGTDGALLGQSTVEISPRPAIAAAVLAQDPRMQDVTASQAGDGVDLGGSAESLDARIDAQRVATAAREGPIANRIGLYGEQVVAVDVQFAAVSSSTLKALGLSFSKISGDIQGAIVNPSGSVGPNGEATAPLAGAFNLFLSNPAHGISTVLSALSSNGLSQLLAQPTLLVRSGEQASFLAGGEVPIPVPQGGTGNTISIQFKEFGVRLSVTPFVLSRDRIVLKIAPEVSELDYTNGVRLQGYTVPGIRRRSAETTVQLGSGQSFVIAGLNYSNSTVSKEKTPLIGDLPVIGAFFKRQQNQQDRQELIIVATPRLVGPMRPDQVPPLPGAAHKVDPSIGDMILGTDGLDQHSRPFGLVRN